MVSLSKLDKDLPFLSYKNTVSDLETLLDSFVDEKVDLAHKIIVKKEKTFADKRYLSWVRHSLSFLKRETSPEIVLKSWSADVQSLLNDEWDKLFEDDEAYALAYMGKLGSNELNLSSDIDLIFFGEEGAKFDKVRKFIKICSASLEVPSGFKVDLDLRPGGKSAPLLCSSNQLGVHLWNQSDPWERYSYTRMQVDLGQKDLKKKLLEVRDKFCYRRYLNSSFFHSFLKLREEYKVDETASSIHLKLGAGGIRDVELFVQTFQILYGGKDVDLRSKSTFEAMELLIEKNIHPKTFQKLKSAYLVLRQAEGELHALNEVGGFEWKKKDTDLDQYLLFLMQVVRNSIKEFSESASNILGRKASNVDRAFFETKILKAVKIDRKDFALENLKNYFSDKNKMFSYYRKAILAQDDMMSAFVDLLSYSEYGSRMLSRRPSLLDMFFLRQNIKADDEASLYENLSDVKMVQRILASNDFVKNKDLSNLSAKITDSYEYILNKVIKNDEGIDLLFMGKMAGQEMGLKSDLDFIIVTEEDLSVSRMALSKRAREIYKKLSYPTVFGPLVPFDKDGGPMGSATPIVINLAKLEKHLKTNAPAWQKLMYIKHRFLFLKNKSMHFVDKPMEEGDFLGLFEILRERLARRSGDPLKLNRGGLFHTEFIISALFLRFGFQPENSVKLNEMCKELSERIKNKDKFDKIVFNYEHIFKARELGFVAGYKKDAELVKIQNDNFDLLEWFSKEFLYGNTVKKEESL